MISGCGEKDASVPEAIMELNSSNLTFSAEAAFQCLSVNSNVGWTATSSDTWLECVPSAGEGDESCVKIKVSGNDDSSSRSAKVQFLAGSLQRSVKVIQSGKELFLSIDPVSYLAMSGSGEVSVSVNSNGVWDLNIPPAVQEWVTLKSTSTAGAVLSLAENSSGNERSCKINFIVTGTSITVPFTLVQKSRSIDIDPSSANILSDAGEISVNVNSGEPWTVEIPQEDAWVSLKSKTETGAIFSVTENDEGVDRTSTIIFRNESGSIQTFFNLTQGKGYVLTGSLDADASLTGKTYSDINVYMKNYGFDYSEHANCSGGYGGHMDGIHSEVEMDQRLNKYVFRFDIHIDPVIDGDRCSASTVDRQRNEMKSATNNTTWAKVQGNWDEWQVIEWNFRLPKGFQPTSSFCHIHQLKAQDGPNNGSPVITITPRSNSDGSNKRIQIIHDVDGANTSKGKIVDNVPLSDFEDEWVHVREEMHYTHNGYYSCRITRISDGEVLIDFKDENIDMWRSGASFIRSKFGIYRSLAGGKLNQQPIGQSPLLKNESVWISDVRVYERNTNPYPGIAHD